TRHPQWSLPPTTLIHPFQSHQHIPRLRPIRGSQDARQFQLIDYPRRSPVPDAHEPPPPRGGADLTLDAHLGGLPEQMVALAQVLSRLPALLPILRLVDRRDLLRDLVLGFLRRLTGVLAIPLHEALRLVGRDERPLHAHQFALARRQEQHLPAPQQG